MKVLIVYPWNHHSRMIEELSHRLTENGIITDALCINDFELIQNSGNITVPFFCEIGRKLRKLSEKYKTERFVDLFDWHLIILLFKQYNIIDFHANYNYHFKMINTCIDHNIKYDITLWGSEVLRSSPANFVKNEYVFKNANRIKGLPNLLESVTLAYQGKYDAKFCETLFGNTNLDVINRYSFNEFYDEANRLVGNKDNKLIVAVGYNGSEAQQHHLIIDALCKLPKDLREKIHIVVPMTYSAASDYVSSINTYLEYTGISYNILTSFLSTKQLALLRQIPNIVINAQTTDAFCGALQEHLYCGNVVMIAEWLKYPMYDRNNVFYVNFTEDNLTSKIIDVIEHYSDYSKQAKENRIIINDVVSWNKSISLWIESYKQTLV